MNQLFQIRQTKQMGRGVFALKPIQVGTRLFTLSQDCYITYTKIVQHRFFCKIIPCQNKYPPINRKVVFAFYMAFVDKNKNLQKHYSQAVVDYIQNLPKVFHNLICWKQDQLNKIKNQCLVKKISQKKKILLQDFKQIKKYLVQPSTSQQMQFNYSLKFYEDKQEYQFQEYQYQEYSFQSEYSYHKFQNQTHVPQMAINMQKYIELCNQIQFQQILPFYSAIQSRFVYNQSDFDKKSEMGALIPTLQLFNHSQNGSFEIKSQIKAKQIRTTIFIDKNQQIFASYGKDIANQVLLENYGFIIDKNFEKIKNQYITTQKQSEQQEQHFKQEKQQEKSTQEQKQQEKQQKQQEKQPWQKQKQQKQKQQKQKQQKQTKKGRQYIQKQSESKRQYMQKEKQQQKLQINEQFPAQQKMYFNQIKECQKIILERQILAIRYNCLYFQQKQRETKRELKKQEQQYYRDIASTIISIWKEIEQT